MNDQLVSYWHHHHHHWCRIIADNCILTFASNVVVFAWCTLYLYFNKYFCKTLDSRPYLFLGICMLYVCCILRTNTFARVYVNVGQWKVHHQSVFVFVGCILILTNTCAKKYLNVEESTIFGFAVTSKYTHHIRICNKHIYIFKISLASKFSINEGHS